MPMSADDLSDIKPKLEAAKKNPVGFAVCLGNTPATTVILFSKTKEPKSLVLAAKKAGETNKTTFGTITVEEGIATLRCADDVPSGLCKRVKGLFALQKITLKVKAFDPSGKATDTDEDDVTGAPQQVAPAQEASVRAADQATTPNPGQPAPGAPTSETVAAREAQRNEAWDKIVAAVGPRVDDYVKGGAEKAPQVAAAWKGALAVAKAGRFDDAMLVVNKIMPLLKDAVRSEAMVPRVEIPVTPPLEVPIQAEIPAAPPPPEPPKAETQAAKPKASFKPEDLTKAARLWRETFKSMQAEMAKLQVAIAKHLSPDPRMAEISAKAADLSDRLDVFDTDLSDALDVAAKADPDAISSLRDEALGHLDRYMQAIETPFFRDVDEANGFAKVAVAAIARRSLGALGKILA